MAAKQLDGSYRIDRDGPPGEAVAAPGQPQPPDHLAGEALRIWQRIVPDLVARRVAAACDADQLASLCDWLARYRKWSRELDEMAADHPGRYQLAVLVGSAQKHVNALAAPFGLNPSDRARLKADPTTPRAGVASRKR